jgi:hypothetical protein
MIQMRDERGGTKAPDTILWREHLHAATMVGRLARPRWRSTAVTASRPMVVRPANSGTGRSRGIPDAASAVHSKRSAEINQAVHHRGFSTYQARPIAARETHKQKRHVAVDALVPMWRRELAEAGFAPQQLEAEIERGRGGVSAQRPCPSLVTSGALRPHHRRAGSRGHVVCAQGVLSPRRDCRHRPPPLRPLCRRAGPRGVAPAARLRGHRVGGCAKGVGAGLFDGQR